MDYLFTILTLSIKGTDGIPMRRHGTRSIEIPTRFPPSNLPLQWGKLRRIASRRSSQSSEGQSRSSSPAETERRKNPGVIDVFRESTRRPSHRTTISNNEGSLEIASPHSRQRSQDRRADPLGLINIYTPQGIPSADIIFIHGLGGTSRQTWSRNRDPELFWPQKWLPLEPDICTTRIFSFGYNAHFSSSGPNSIANISDFAKSLLFAMKFWKGGHDGDLQIGNVGLERVVQVLL